MFPLQMAGLLATPLGKLLAAIIVMAVLILIGRIVLNIAWKVVVIGGVVVGALYVASLFLSLP